jgi:hypothetical protein
MVLFIACNTDKPKDESKLKDSLTTQKNLEGKNNIYFQDKSLYSKEFVSELIEKGYTSPIKVIKDHLIVEGNKVYFPTELNLNKEYTFLATDSNQNLILKVKRINYTTLNFNFTSTKNDSLVFRKTGFADLGAYFFLAAEVSEDEETGDSYGANQYNGEVDGCELHIGIGIGKDDEGRFRAFIYEHCEEKTKKLKFNESKTLRTQKNAL